MIYKLYAENRSSYINDITRRGPAFSDKTAINYIPLHGSVHNNDTLIFDPLEIVSTYNNSPDKWNYLTTTLKKHPTLFWGYSLSDASVLNSFAETFNAKEQNFDKWIVLYHENSDDIEYFKTFDFNIIISSTDELLEYMGSISSKRAPATISQSVSTLVQKYSIPSISDIPVRPIVNFYLGDNPTWYDIFSGKIHKTSHYKTTKDKILSKQGTIILGMPASGKTTLLMQLAADVDFKGHKLILESPSIEKANLLISQLNGEPSLVFIDDFTMDIDAFTTLYQESNIQVVGADRDYMFDIISHRIPFSSFNFCDITELDDQDMQSIFLKMPAEIRNSKITIPKIEGTSRPSIFEIVQQNIAKQKLGERFQDVLLQLKNNDPVLFDLLIMCCYVHSCRTPVSFDMAYAFLNKNITSYHDVYRCFEKLQSLANEYTGYLIDSNQDHFTPRSTIVSDTVLDNLNPEDLKRVIINFHKEVSSYRICSYHIFRRKAFDADLMKKAFPNWKDGISFYQEISNDDESPYLKQQCALYLASKRQFVEAFRWIDDAMSSSKKEIFSIKNSHAIILFKANIFSSNEDENTIRQTLMHSMDILAHCYNDDKRKAYHALVFADQAIKFSERYGDEISFGYLKKAEKWLIEEKRKAEWNRKIRYTLKSIQETLRGFSACPSNN